MSKPKATAYDKVTAEQTRARIIENIKTPFNTFNEIHLGYQKALAFSEAFCNAYLDWVDTFSIDTKKAATKIAFVRAIFPDMSEDSDAYRADNRFMSAQNLFAKGMKSLKESAKAAMDKGKATVRQKTLLAAPQRKTAAKAKAPGIKGLSIPVISFFEALADCDIDIDNFGRALKNRKVPEAVVNEIISAMKATAKRVAEEV
jgi:hypothetical protein